MATNTYKTDMPPTPADARMRSKHTADSVRYNMSHMSDHVGGMKDSLSKLATVDKPKANSLATTMSSQIHKLADKVKGDKVVKSPGLASYIKKTKFGSKAIASIAKKG